MSGLSKIHHNLRRYPMTQIVLIAGAHPITAALTAFAVLKILEKIFKVKIFGFWFSAYFGITTLIGVGTAYMHMVNKNPGWKTFIQEGTKDTITYYAIMLATMFLLALLQYVYRKTKKSRTMQ
jgi:hypothetical protein